MAAASDLPVSDFVIPAVVWAIILGYYKYQSSRRPKDKMIAGEVGADHIYYPNYFFYMRGGWVRKNKCTLQAVANSTRDYLRVIIFFAGLAATMTAIFASYAAKLYNDASTTYQFYTAFKLGCCAGICALIFFTFISSIRYGTQFHFLMNVEEVNGIPMNWEIVTLVFDRTYQYHAAGMRLHFALIPMFFWMASSWALLAVCPFYLLLVMNYDDMNFLEPDLEDMYRGTAYEKKSSVTAI